MQNNCTKRRLRLEFLQFAFFKFKMRRKHTKNLPNNNQNILVNCGVVFENGIKVQLVWSIFFSLLNYFSALLFLIFVNLLIWSKIQEWDFFTDLHTQCLFGKLQEKKQIIQFHTSFSWIFAYENGIFGSRTFSLEMLHSIRAAVLLFCQLWQETSLTWPQHQHLGYKKENANVLHLDTISTSMEGTEGKDCISRNVDVIKHVCLMPASPILYYFETNKIGHTWLALHYWCRKDICRDLKCTCRLRNFPLVSWLISCTESAGKEVFNIHCYY